MIKQQLESLFGVAFSQQTAIVALRQFHQANAFCLDAAGELLGLCATDIALESLDLPDFPGLVYLNLSGNKSLRGLRFAAPLRRLQHLDVSDCGLETFKMQAGFERLEWLDISRNQLHTFNPLGPLERLQQLDLSGNQFNYFSPHLLLRLPNLAYFYLKGNPLTSSTQLPVAENRGSCLRWMQNLLLDLKKGETPNREYKVLLVGNGGVGKSCLVERLVYQTFDERHLSTHGVALEQYLREENDYPYVLNLWDFGGQDIYHATHRLFMQSNALYLALWDETTRTEAQSPHQEAGQERFYENYPLDYWLHYIRHQGKNSPVLVVKTKCDDHGDLHPDQYRLKPRYDVQDFLQIDSRTAKGCEKLLLVIREAIEEHLVTAEKLAVNWVGLRQFFRRLLQEGNKAISLDDFVDFASDFEIAGPLEGVLPWLVNTGAVFYRKGYFGDMVILDQAWAIKAIYTIFRRDNGHYYRLRDYQDGRFSGADLQTIWEQNFVEEGWQKKAYTEAEQLLFVNFMLSCELCFEVTTKEKDSHHIPFAERQFIAPQLLPDKVPTIATFLEKQPDLLYISYRHDFLHSGLIQQFIVRAQSLADKRDIWKNGIVLEEEGALAMVQIVSAEKRSRHAYDVQVLCSRRQLSLLDKIRNTLEELQGEALSEWVSLDGEAFVELSRLKECPYKDIDAENNTRVPTAELKIFLERRGQEKFSPPSTSTAEKVEKLMQQVEREQEKDREPASEQAAIPELAFEEGVIKVLFLQANPTTNPISWTNEYVAISEKLEVAKDQFSLEKRKHTNRDKLFDAIEDEEPTILHFCGHGKDYRAEDGFTGGLVLHNEDMNGEDVLSAEVLRQMFRDFKEDQPQLQLVLLNACYSSEQAAAISEAGIIAIGTADQITSAAARKFAAGLYQSLAKRTDFMTAIRRGRNRARTSDPDVGELIKAYYNGECFYPI